MTDDPEDPETETVYGLYRRSLLELAVEHGEDYARDTAALTISTLLSMVSRGHARLPQYPLFLAPRTDGSGASGSQKDPASEPRED